MIAKFKPCRLHGRIDAPPSKSMAHRYLICASLSGQRCTISGIDYSDDILASIDALSALGAKITVDGGSVTVDPTGFMKAENIIFSCKESGSTLRFLIPLSLTLGKPVVLRGSERLFERPLGVYEELCRDRGFTFNKGKDSLTVCGSLSGGDYRISGDVSSQFITGLLFALVYLGKRSSLEIIPPFYSRPYVDMTISALKAFGANIEFTDEYKIEIIPARLHAFFGRVEGDFSNAAFLDAFNRIGSEIEIGNLTPGSLQGDRVYSDYFDMLSCGMPTLDVSDCPDLAPVLIALASLGEGAVLTGTDRLRAKESDRGRAMHEELSKLGGGLIFGDNSITVPGRNLEYKGAPLDGHGDHRIVMALSVILSVTGGEIAGAEAVKKSYPSFFDDIKRLGAEVELI